MNVNPVLSSLRLTPEKVRSAIAKAPPVEKSAAKAAPVKQGVFAVPGFKWLQAECEIVSYVVQVSPAIAGELLKKNSANRKPSQAKIERFASAMKRGLWSLNGETIKLSAGGRLLDGQSRLEAIVRSGMTVALEMRVDLPDRAQESMDCGEVRKGSHTLEMMGESNPGELAAALRMLFMHEQRNLTGRLGFESVVLENSMIKEFLAKHAGLKVSLGWAKSRAAAVRKLMPVSEAGFFHYVLGNSAKRDSFIEGLIDGVGLTRTSVVYLLRERLLEERVAVRKIDKTTRLALITIAWNAHLKGEKLGKLMWKRGDAFPVIKAIVEGRES